MTAAFPWFSLQANYRMVWYFEISHIPSFLLSNQDHLISIDAVYNFCSSNGVAKQPKNLNLNGFLSHAFVKLMDLTETGREGVDWMHPAQERDQWRTVVNTVMNLRGIS
jgi:hypothetical protein